MGAGDEKGRDARQLKAGHLLDDVESGAVVLPVAVVEVAGDDEEIDALFEAEADEVLQR